MAVRSSFIHVKKKEDPSGFAIASSVSLLFRSKPWKRLMTARESFSILLIVFEIFSLNSSFSFASHTISFHIGMKVILPVSSLVHTVNLPSSLESDCEFPL